MQPKLLAAVQGGVVGATLGAPFKGKPGFRRINFYEPIPTRVAASPALDAWLLYAGHLARGGTAMGVSAVLRDSWRYDIDGSLIGLANARRGLAAPISGSWENPLGESSQSLGRAAYWGLAFSGSPEQAAEYAYFDSATDHWGEGVRASVAVAWSLARLGPSETCAAFCTRLIEALPGKSKAYKTVRLALNMAGQGDYASAYARAVQQAAGVSDLEHASISLGAICCALLAGRGAFGSTILTAAGLGGATDQTALISGVVAGYIEPPAREWLDPLSDSWVSGHGLRQEEPPKTIQEFVSRVSAPFRAEAEPSPAPVEEVVEGPIEVDGEPLPESAPISLPPAPEPRLPACLDFAQDEAVYAFGSAMLAVKYVDGPSCRSGEACPLGLTFRNVGSESLSLEPSLTVQASWKVATRMTSFRLQPGKSSTFPALITAAGQPGTWGSFSVVSGAESVAAPLLVTPRWYWVGPFVNHDGEGFDKSYPAESQVSRDAVFAGRSGLEAKWEPLDAVRLIDVELTFAGGPGVGFLFARLRFAKAQRATLVVACSVGAIATLDGKKVLWYHDEREPSYRPVSPYSAQVEVQERSELLIKVLRNKSALRPLLVYWIAEDGTLLEPLEFEEL